MGTSTVIDQLIIKLGLDPKDFTKGEKEVAKQTLDLEKKVTGSANNMSLGLGKVATRFLGMAAAIATLKKTVDFIDDVANRTRKLGIDAKNYDIASEKLRNFENAVEMAGGSAEAARGTIAGFQKSIFDLAYNGQVSDSLVMLTRLGVQFQDGAGHARDFNDVILDTADAIEKAQKNGMSRGNAFQYLQQSGFDAGTAQLILSGRGGIEAAQKQQKGRFQADRDAVAQADHVVRSRIDKEQQIEAFGVESVHSGAGNVQSAINQAIAHPTETLNKLGDAAYKAGTALEDWALKASGTTRGLRNNNPGNLKATGHQRRDRNGFAMYDTMEEGIKAAAHQLDLYERRDGIHTTAGAIGKWAPKSENNVKAYLDDIQKSTGIKPGENIDGQEALLLSGMFKHESGGKGVRTPSAEEIADILTMQDDVGPTGANSAPPTPGASNGTTYNRTDVHIDGITVNTAAKDADKLASDMDAAMQRKLMASHAEPGVQ